MVWSSSLTPSSSAAWRGDATSARQRAALNTLRRPEQRLLQIVLHRLVAEPDAQQRAVEILALDRAAGGLAVDHDLRVLAGPVERDAHALLRFPRSSQDGAQLLHARLDRFCLRVGSIG